MSGSMLACYLLLIVVLGFRLCVNFRRKTWETHDAASVEEALAKIKELYPDAVHGPWQGDGSGWLPADEVLYVWETPEAYKRNAPPVARVRRYTP